MNIAQFLSDLWKWKDHCEKNRGHFPEYYEPRIYAARRILMLDRYEFVDTLHFEARLFPPGIPKPPTPYNPWPWIEALVALTGHATHDRYPLEARIRWHLSQRVVPLETELDAEVVRRAG